MTEQYKRNPNTKCSVCDILMYRRPVQLSRGRVFCSLFCYGKTIRKEIPCRICGTLILASANKKTCSRICANKSRIGNLYKIGRPSKDKVKDQRIVKQRLVKVRGDACERCGYGKTEILNVHHKDRDRSHNDLSNLELICPNCHGEEHYSGGSWLNKKLAK